MNFKSLLILCDNKRKVFRLVLERSVFFKNTYVDKNNKRCLKEKNIKPINEIRASGVTLTT